MKCCNMETILLYEKVLNHALLHTHCASVCYSVEMMGHPDLRSECDINQLEPLLQQDVVDDLLSKYVKTFTVNIKHTYNQGEFGVSCSFVLCLQSEKLYVCILL